MIFTLVLLCDFKFDIVNFPFLDSNIPTNPAYGVYISQIVRLSRICCDYTSFIKRHYMMTSWLIRQGFWYSKLCKKFKHYSRRHSTLFNKFGTSLCDHIHDGICLPACAVVTQGRHVAHRKTSRAQTKKCQQMPTSCQLSSCCVRVYAGFFSLLSLLG